MLMEEKRLLLICLISVLYVYLLHYKSSYVDCCLSQARIYRCQICRQTALLATQWAGFLYSHALHALIFTQLTLQSKYLLQGNISTGYILPNCLSQSLAPSCFLSPPIAIWTQDITQTTAVDNWNLFSNGKNDPVSSGRQQPGPTKGILKHFQPAQMKSVSLLF